MKYSKRTVGVSRDALRRQADKASVAKSETTKRSSSGAKEINGRVVLTDPAARINGGPKHGQVRLVADLEHDMRIAERMGRACAYTRTRRHTRLPGVCDPAGGDLKGEVWDWVEVARDPIFDIVTSPMGPMACTGCARPLLHPTSRTQGVCWTCKPFDLAGVS